MNTKSNQGLTTFDFITMVFSLVVIVGISIPIIQKNLESGNMEQAQKEALSLASRLLNSKDSASLLRIASDKPRLPEKSEGRAIASIGKSDVAKDIPWTGQSGKDPWGNPYHFRFMRNAKGMPVEIAVWSDGPDKADSVPDIKSSSINGVERLEFHKNDVVVSTLPVR